MRAGRVMGIVAVAAVAAAIVGGIIVLGSPSEQRQRRLDERRVQDLRRIAWAVDRYWTRHDSLPPDLAVLAADGSAHSLADPETGASYVYRIDEGRSFELCAVFARQSADEPPPAPPWRDWTHGAGKHCFRLEPRNGGAGDSPGHPDRHD